MTEDPIELARIAREAEEDAGPIGPFPNWTAVYVTVVVFVAACIGILAWFTAALDFSVVS